MVTRSIVGRFLILAVLVVSLGVLAQAGLIIMQGGSKKAVTAAAATPAAAATAAAPPAATTLATAEPAGAEPVRVVYPGPLGPAPTQKIADAAPPSPLPASPAPAAAAPTAAALQPSDKLAQAMASTAAPPVSVPVAVGPQTGAAPAQPSAPAAAVPQTVAAVVPPPSTQAAPSPPQPVADAVPATPTEPPAPQPVATAEPAPPAAPAAKSVEVASLGGSAPAAATAAPSRGVDINRASVEALNHLGGGRIGESIAKHRPYRSVEDLVKKRVLRRSVFEQIKRQIAAK